MKLNIPKQMKMNQRGLGEIGGQKIKADSAKQERPLAFSHSMETSGQPVEDLHKMLAGRRVPQMTVPVGHILAARPCDLCTQSSGRDASSGKIFIS